MTGLQWWPGSVPNTLFMYSSQNLKIKKARHSRKTRKCVCMLFRNLCKLVSSSLVALYCEYSYLYELRVGKIAVTYSTVVSFNDIPPVRSLHGAVFVFAVKLYIKRIQFLFRKKLQRNEISVISQGPIVIIFAKREPLYTDWELKESSETKF